DGAYERLRMALLRVKEHPDLGDAVRDQLTKKLQTNLRDVSNQGTQIKLKLAQQEAAKATALAAADKDMLRKTEEERFEARFKVYRNLMNEARYDILRRQAATEEILKGMMQIHENADFMDDRKGRELANDVELKLEQTVDVLKDLAPVTNLKDFLLIFYEKLNSGNTDYPIIIDDEAFKAENPEAAEIYDTPLNFKKYQYIKKMTLSTALRLALKAIPTNNATYWIRRDFVEITTV